MGPYRKASQDYFVSTPNTSVSVFSARCNIYISRSCYDVSVRLSVTEVHWHSFFKFRSQFTAHCGRGLAVHSGASTELFIVQWARGKGSSPGRVEGSSRAMLATARPSCLLSLKFQQALQTPTISQSSACDNVAMTHPMRTLLPVSLTISTKDRRIILYFMLVYLPLPISCLWHVSSCCKSKRG